jgi:hypothetical protein
LHRTDIVAAVLLGAAVATPSSLLLDLFLGHPAGIGVHAELGVLFLRVGVVLLALAALLLGRYPASERGFPRAAFEARPWTWECTALVALLVPAAALRAYRLDAQLWFDEILLSLRFVDAGVTASLATFDASNHALYSLLAILATAVFGASEWALRLPAMLFGVGSIAALFAFASVAVGRREALLSAALLTFSYHHIWFSQNARGYTAALFWALTSSYLLFRALEAPTSRRLWIGYALTSALGVFTMDFHAAVVAAQLCVYLAFVFRDRSGSRSDRFLGLAFGFGLATVLGFVSTSLQLPQKLDHLDLIEPLHAELFEISEVFEAPIAAKWLDPEWALEEAVTRVDSAVGAAVGLCALGAFLLGGFVSWRRAPAVVVLALVPVIPLLGMWLLEYPIFPRLFFFTAGFAILIVVTGVTWMGDRVALVLSERFGMALPLGYAAGGIVVAVSAATIPGVYAPKQDYLGAMAFIEANRQPSDVVAAGGRMTVTPYVEYYGKDWLPMNHDDDPEEMRELGAPVWIVHTFPNVLGSEAYRVARVIREHGTERARFPGTLGGGDVVVSLLEWD